MSTVLRRLRRLFPQNGLPYELFNSSVLLGLLAFFWYVGSEPSAVTRDTIGYVFDLLLSPRWWGVGLIASSVVGIVCAYLSRWWWRSLLWGYLVIACAAGGWSMALLASTIISHPGYDITMKALGSALLFGWITRGLITAVIQAAAVGSHDVR